MTAQSNIGKFLRVALVVAAIGGVVAGVALGVNESVRGWRAGGFDVCDVLYLAVVAGGLIVVAGGLFARAGRQTIPFVSMIVGLAVLGIAFNGLSRDFTGQIAELFVWASGCSFGAALGLFLARWMVRRAERSKNK